jgi:hypothetical protein
MEDKKMEINIKRLTVICLCLITILLIPKTDAFAVVPYLDTDFLNKTNPDLDLVIAREKYMSTTYRQAIYFRATDKTWDWDALSGHILFPTPITIVSVRVKKAGLFPSQFNWGIPGADYSGTFRGLELNGGDYIAWDSNNIWFDFNIVRGVDEMRVIIDYGDSFYEGAYFDVALNSGTSQSGSTYSSGIVVGDTAGSVPGSGDYGELWSARVPLTSSSAVPEPATLALFGAGLLGAGIIRKRKIG